MKSIAATAVLIVMSTSSIARETTPPGLASYYDVPITSEVKWDAYEALQLYNNWKKHAEDDYIRIKIEELRRSMDRLNKDVGPN